MARERERERHWRSHGWQHPCILAEVVQLRKSSNSDAASNVDEVTGAITVRSLVLGVESRPSLSAASRHKGLTVFCLQPLSTASMSRCIGLRTFSESFTTLATNARGPYDGSSAVARLHGLPKAML